MRAAAIDADAGEELFRRHLPAVYRYVHARSRSQEEAADFAQEVFLKACAALPRYRPTDSPFIVWLIRIARNLISDDRRRVPDLPLLAAETLEAADADPEAIAIRREATARVRALLDTLDRDKRELLLLRFAAGLTSREIALVVGRSEAAVKKQLTRTIHMLKENYRED